MDAASPTFLPSLCALPPHPIPSIHTCYLPASPHSVSQSFLAPAKSITFVPSLLNTGRPSVSCMARVSVASQDETGEGAGTGTQAARGTFRCGVVVVRSGLPGWGLTPNWDEDTLERVTALPRSPVGQNPTPKTYGIELCLARVYIDVWSPP